VIGNEEDHKERGARHEVVARGEEADPRARGEISAAAEYKRREKTLVMASRRFASLPAQGL